jgi:Reverse transcriptase (RNA-dependent DNA polymerase)
MERYKARVVILGNLQQVGVDYDLTFAPVIDFTIVRLLLAVASKKGYTVHHMDVKSAFLNSQVDADVVHPENRTGHSPADSQGIGHHYSKLSFMR